MTKAEDEMVGRAFLAAVAAHGDQKRKYTGEPYVTHPVEVMMMVREVGGTPEMMAAALLHDVVEDTDWTLGQIRILFGPLVALFVEELTEVQTEGNRAQRKAKETIRLSKISGEAQTIKCADLISNSRSIMERDPKFAKVYIPEKRAILAVLKDAEPTLLAMAKEIVA